MNNQEDQHAQLRASHTPEAVRERLDNQPSYYYLRDFVYGAVDGAVTTFAVVSGVAGAELSTGIIIVLGVANLVGDGFSMAAGNFLGTRADDQMKKRARQTEEEHIELYPEGEREEVRQILAAKGFEGEDLKRAVETVTSDRQRWVDLMMTDELGHSLRGPKALRAALVTFVAFVAVGLIPLLSFLIDYFSPVSIAEPFLISSVLTGTAFFAVGAAKALFVEQKWYWAGSETLIVGGSAAGIAYVIGALLKGLI
jgi:vacuolar iron transporter family protein